MLTMFLSAVCALGVNTSVVTAPADTLDKYIINGEKVEKFDGSLLVGKTISDYKVTVTSGNAAGDAVRVHLIRTDGQKIKAVGSATFTVYIIDGKKRDKAALNRIKAEAIASMTVYKPGSKEAVRLSGDDNVTVIEVVTK